MPIVRRLSRRLGLAAALAVPVSMASLPRAADPLVQLREVASPALPGAGQQNLAVGPEGRVYLSWVDRLPDSTSALRFAALGSEWSTPRTIAAGRDWFINWADFPMLSVTGRTMVAHWLEKSGRSTYAYDVRLTRSLDGGATWSAPQTPHRDGTQTEHGFASMFPAGDGAVGIVWVDGRLTADADRSRHQMALRTTTLLANGTLGPEIELDERICDCCQTAAAVTAEGPVVVYRDRTGDEIRDIGIVRRVGGAWTAPAIVAADGWRINACPVNGPAVAADGRRVAVAWYTAAGGVRRVKAAFSDDAGASFGAPVVVDDGRPVGRVGVVMLEGGAALVSWLEDIGEGAEVRVRRVEASGGRGDAMAVTRTSAGRPSGFPRMERSGDRVVFAWRDPEGAGAARVRTAVARIAPAR